MNPNAQNQPVPSAELSTSNLQPSTFAGYRGNGKVARLPKPVRDQICNWMLDGLSYPDIIERLGEQGKDLNPGHLCEWKKRGFQDWLLEQAWLAQTRARQEPAVALSADFDATQLNHAALQLGTLHIFEALRDLNPSGPPPGPVINSEDTAGQNTQPDHALAGRSDSLYSSGREGQGEEAQPTTQARQKASDLSFTEVPTRQIQNPNSKPKAPRPRSQLDLRLGGDSSAFVRLINALARASRETMLVQKYRDACAQARAALQELKDPNRKLNEKETRAIVRKLDEILGFPTSEDDEPSSTPAPNEQPPLASAAWRSHSPTHPLTGAAALAGGI